MRDLVAERQARRETARRRVNEWTERVETITVPASEVREGDWLLRIHPLREGDRVRVRGLRFGAGERVTISEWETATTIVHPWGIDPDRPVRTHTGWWALGTADHGPYRVHPDVDVTVRRRYEREEAR